MLRVLHINDYPDDAGGGAEVVMRQTVALLRQQGLDVKTFTSADLPDARRTPRRYVVNPVACRALADCMQEFRPDVVHLHNWYHVLSPGILETIEGFKRRHPFRVLVTAHDYHLVCPNAGGSWFHPITKRRESIDRETLPLKRLWFRCWDERSLLHSLLKVSQHWWNYRWHARQRVIDLVLCPSRFVQGLIRTTGLATIWLPHSAPNLQGLTRFGAKAPHLRFVFAGRLEPEKGLAEFLQRLPDNFEAEMTVIGDGSARRQCEAICRSRPWGTRVEFIGRLTHQDTLAQIARCHVLVQPSRVLETYGLTLIEALISGTNLLVTSRGAAREIVDDSGVGFLYDVDEPEDLRRQLQKINLRFAEGILNRFDVSAFLSSRSEHNYVKALLQAYEGAVIEDSPDGSARNRVAA